MEMFQTKIGEHYLQITSSSSRMITALKNNFSSILDYHQPDIEIFIEGDYGVPFQNYKVAVKENESAIFFRRADYHIQVRPDFTQANISVHDELALKHALMNLYSSFIVHYNWGLLLHSSCVLDKQKAHLFSGRSGAGKSTAAQLSAPRELLSDEAAIVKITENDATAYDSPFRSELKAAGGEEPSPLESIQLLHQSMANKRVELKKSASMLQLLDKVFYWPYQNEETTKVLFLVKRLVENVPVYDLHFEKNNTFWELISS